MGTALEKIKGLKEQIANELEGVKTELKTQLETACETYKEIVSLGYPDVLKERQFAKFIHVLSIVDETIPKARLKRRGKRSANSTSDKILDALKNGGKTTEQLQKATGTKWINVAISKLLKEKKIKSDGKRPATYSLK